MKKILKSISLMCLALLLICPVFLTGCSKNLTLNFTVEGVGGSFYKFSDSTDEMTGKSISGETVIKEGSTFEYSVIPDYGYLIKELFVDGEVVQLSDREKEEGTVRNLSNIKANHEVKATFELREWSVKFVCVGNGLTNPELFVLKKVLHNTAINVGTNEFGGADNAFWYTIKQNGDIEFSINGQDDPEKALAADWQKNQIIINSDRVVYCNLTLAQLQAKLAELSA